MYGYLVVRLQPWDLKTQKEINAYRTWQLRMILKGARFIY